MIYFELKELLEKRSLTMTELSEKTGISRTTLSQLSTGKSQGIKFNTLDKLAYALNLNDNAISSLFKFVPDNFAVTPYSVVLFPQHGNSFSGYTLYKKEAYGTTYVAATYNSFKPTEDGKNTIDFISRKIKDISASTIYSSDPNTSNTPPAFIDNLAFNNKILSRTNSMTFKEIEREYFNQIYLLLDKAGYSFPEYTKIQTIEFIPLDQLSLERISINDTVFLEKQSEEYFKDLQKWQSDQPAPYDISVIYSWNLTNGTLSKNTVGSYHVYITSKHDALYLDTATYINI